MRKKKSRCQSDEKKKFAGKKIKTDIDCAKGEFIFFLDRSASMEGNRIKKATEALILFIKSLPTDSYFNVVSFGSNYQSLFPSSVQYSDKWISKAVEKIFIMSADMGGT